jgi:hypothetical protein
MRRASESIDTSPTSIVRRGPGGLATAERTQPGGELGEGEGLGEVVVRAGVEPEHAVVDGIARGHEQDPHRVLALSDPPGELEAGHAGHHHVHDRQVERLLAEGDERLDTVLDGRDPVPLGRESAFHQGTHLVVVLDHQQPHNGPPRTHRGIEPARRDVLRVRLAESRHRTKQNGLSHVLGT